MSQSKAFYIMKQQDLCHKQMNSTTDGFNVFNFLGKHNIENRNMEYLIVVERKILIPMFAGMS